MLGNLLAPTSLPWQGIPPSGTPCLPRFLRVRCIRLFGAWLHREKSLEIPGENPPGPMSPEKNKAVPTVVPFNPSQMNGKQEHTRTI